MPIVLGVNIDHIATLREVRGTSYPDPVDGALICEKCGVHGVTMHLREDRRHIQERDIIEVQKVLSKCTLNLEMALSDDVISFARKIRPYMVTIVPERREELTTEGGLDVESNCEKITRVIDDFHSLGILVSLFIESESEIVTKSRKCGADYVEIHTGAYADAVEPAKKKVELERLYQSAKTAKAEKLSVNAGHGLNYDNITPVFAMEGLDEVNIGHSIIARSVFDGLENAIREMKALCDKG